MEETSENSLTVPCISSNPTHYIPRIQPLPISHFNDHPASFEKSRVTNNSIECSYDIDIKPISHISRYNPPCIDMLLQATSCVGGVDETPQQFKSFRQHELSQCVVPSQHCQVLATSYCQNPTPLYYDSFQTHELECRSYESIGMQPQASLGGTMSCAPFWDVPWTPMMQQMLSECPMVPKANTPTTEEYSSKSCLSGMVPPSSDTQLHNLAYSFEGV